MERKKNLSRLTSAKVLTVFVLLCVMLFALSSKAWACTGIYVGPEASEDGTVLIAKSNDYQSNFANYVTVVDRVENEPDRTMPVNNSGSVTAESPATTYRYTATPFMDSTRPSTVSVRMLPSAPTSAAYRWKCPSPRLPTRPPWRRIRWWRTV